MGGMKIAALFLGFVIVSTAWASCAGVPGCDDCRDSEIVAGVEQLRCRAHADCAAVETECGYWKAVAKSAYEKEHRRVLAEQSRRKRTTAGVRPSVGCRSAGDGKAKECRVVSHSPFFNESAQEWYECRSEEDCVVVVTGCGAKAVRREHRRRYETWARARETAMDCVTGAQTPPGPPRCRFGQCEEN